MTERNSRVLRRTCFERFVDDSSTSVLRNVMKVKECHERCLISSELFDLCVTTLWPRYMDIWLLNFKVIVISTSKLRSVVLSHFWILNSVRLSIVSLTKIA